MKLPNEQERVAAIEIAKAVAEAIRSLGSVPAGHLYAQLMGQMNLAFFESVISVLVGAGLVRRDPSHLLTWTGR